MCTFNASVYSCVMCVNVLIPALCQKNGKINLFAQPYKIVDILEFGFDAIYNLRMELEWSSRQSGFPKKQILKFRETHSSHNQHWFIYRVWITEQGVMAMTFE